MPGRWPTQGPTTQRSTAVAAAPLPPLTDKYFEMCSPTKPPSRRPAAALGSRGGAELS